MNDVSLVYVASAADAPAGALPDLTEVEVLSATSTDEGDAVPAGTQGTIVGIWGDGAAYEVEFAPPIAGLATIDARDLRAVEARRA